MAVDSVSGGSSVTAAQLQSMDIETALMTVQADRANNLEKSIKDQMETVRQRNANIAGMNKLMAHLRGMKNDPNNKDTGWIGWGRETARQTEAAMRSYGLSVDKDTNSYADQGGAKDKFDVWIEELKGKADAESSSQQMDMLRLQSLTNKRNEAFELMTNFIKKISDSKSGVISNLR